MRRTLGPAAPAGLERPCTAPADRLHYAADAFGLQRAEVSLSRTGFRPHRHDRYALGITSYGVQSFRYRGDRRVCLAGQVHVLHPDEEHDGMPGDEHGFGYRIVYVSPELVRDASPTGRLPFVPEPVHDARGNAAPLAAVLADLLADVDEPLDPLGAPAAAIAIADGLTALTDRTVASPVALDTRAVRRVHDYLTAHPTTTTTATTLEAIAGLDRYTLIRHFKAAYGTTPDRYRLLRRLDVARGHIARGMPLALAAVESGFADQSHLTRQFARAFGMAPGRWRRLAGE